MRRSAPSTVASSRSSASRPSSSPRTPRAGAAPRSRAARSPGSRRRSPSARPHRPREPCSSNRIEPRSSRWIPASTENGRDLLRPVQVPIVVPEHRADRHLDLPAGLAPAPPPRRGRRTSSGRRRAGRDRCPVRATRTLRTTRSRSSGEAWTSPAAATRIGRPFSMPASCPTRRGYMPCNGGYHRLRVLRRQHPQRHGPDPEEGGCRAARRRHSLSGRGRGRLLGTRRPVDRPRPRFPDQAVGRRPRARDTGGRGVAPGDAAGGVALQGVGRGRAGRPDLLAPPASTSTTS